jgi:hypothetical protein
VPLWGENQKDAVVPVGTNQRFTAGVEGLAEGRSKPPGRKPISAAINLKVVERTVKERPVNAAHWSVRTMAKEMGISQTSVQRIWAEHDLKPHLVKGFKVSTDPTFAVKVEDIIGLSLDPPERALVLAIDEKSQIQALDPAGPAMIISATAPRRCLPRSTSRPAKSSANVYRRAKKVLAKATRK